MHMCLQNHENCLAYIGLCYLNSCDLISVGVSASSTYNMYMCTPVDCVFLFHCTLVISL